MKNALTTLFLLCSLTIFSQTWQISTIQNAFDGEFQRASVTGRGNNYPYNSPYLIINNQEEEPTIYISDIGYTGCGGNVLWFAFDGKVLFSTQDVTESLESDALFINSVKRGAEGWKVHVDSPKVSNFYLFERMIKASKMSVRWSGDCSSNDITFSLNNSGKAIQVVIGDIDLFMAKEADKKLELQKLKRVEDSIKQFTEQWIKAEEQRRLQHKEQRLKREQEAREAKQKVISIWLESTYSDFINNTSARKLSSPIQLESSAEIEVRKILSENYDKLMRCKSCTVTLVYNKGWKDYGMVIYNSTTKNHESLYLSLKQNPQTKLLEVH